MFFRSLTRSSYRRGNGYRYRRCPLVSYHNLHANVRTTFTMIYLSINLIIKLILSHSHISTRSPTPPAPASIKKYLSNFFIRIINYSFAIFYFLFSY